eukprot:TRINITY_DN8584_c0_g1_i2.p1 TRINITY_DN8584_c0_g1~~TRINITY_DN8584_c0_g1_i2.p1  ORF type:complete len:266 (+),score=36.87 TRINITY_DN8584_c0_g1_i2:140-937(+)
MPKLLISASAQGHFEPTFARMQIFVTVTLVFVAIADANEFWDVTISYANDDCSSSPSFVSIIKLQNDVCIEHEGESERSICTADAATYVSYTDTNCSLNEYRYINPLGNCTDASVTYCGTKVDSSNLQDVAVQSVFTGYEDSACTKAVNIFGSAAGACIGSFKYRKVGKQVFLDDYTGFGCDTLREAGTAPIATAGECISGDDNFRLSAPYVKVSFAEDGNSQFSSFLAAAGVPTDGAGNNNAAAGNNNAAAAIVLLASLVALLI